MEKQYTHTTKIQDGTVLLGRSHIDANSLTVDGGALPATMTLDATHGIVKWSGAQGDPGPYEFSYDYFQAARVDVSADKSEIAADGIEEVELTITVEDLAETIVSVAVYEAIDGRIGEFDVSILNGTGQITKTIAVAGVYTYRVNPDTLDPTWAVAKFTSIQGATVKAV